MNLPRNLILASILLIMVSIFGGDLFGSWFVNESKIEDAGYLVIEDEMRFMLEEVEVKSNCEAPKAQEYCLELYGEIKETNDYDYDSEDWEAINDIMHGQIKILLYLCLLSACAILYFINEKDTDKSAIGCCFLGSGCILIVLLFIFIFPLALEEDTTYFSDVDETPSIYGKSEFETPDPNDGQIFVTEWKPGFAPLLVLLSGIMALMSFYDIKIRDNSENAVTPVLVTNYEINDENNANVFTPKEDEINDEPKTNVDVFTPKEDTIACPGCGSMMKIPILNKIQNVKCVSCGLEGDIEK